MPKSNESFGERFRKISLWQWGLICIGGAMTSGALMNAQGPPKNRAEAAGRGAAVLLFVVVGSVLIVVHFVRPKKKGGPPVTPSREGSQGATGVPPRRGGGKRS
jgi:hypothetical protein